MLSKDQQPERTSSFKEVEWAQKKEVSTGMEMFRACYETRIGALGDKVANFVHEPLACVRPGRIKFSANYSSCKVLRSDQL